MEKDVIGVTGGAGYIGSHLVRFLLQAGKKVRVLDNMSYGRDGLIGIKEQRGLEIVEGDICDIRSMARFLRGCHTVIALAAIVGDPACALNEDETLSVNYHSTALLVHLSEEMGCRRIVFASSCSVYGGGGGLILNEGSRLEPVSLYASTRIMSENLLLRETHKVEPVILRLATVFGWSQRMRFDLVVNILTAKALREGKISIFGGSQWRPQVHCADAARAFMLAAQAPGELVAGEIFNVGSSAMNYQIEEIGKMVVQRLPSTAVETFEEIEDKRDYNVSFDKIRSILGFETRHSVLDGIEEILLEMENHPAMDYLDSRYYNVRYLYR